MTREQQVSSDQQSNDAPLKILITLLTGVFLLSYATGTISIGLPLFLYAQGFSFGSVGVILSVSPLLIAMVYYLSAAASDIISRHKMIMTASLVQSVSIGLIPFASIIEQFAILQIGIGSSSAFQRSIPPALILENSAFKSRGMRLTVLQGITNGGASLGIVLSGFIITIFGFQTLFFISSIIGFIGFFTFIISNRFQSKQQIVSTQRLQTPLVREPAPISSSTLHGSGQRFLPTLSPRGFPHNIRVLFIAGLFFGAAAGIDMFAIPLFFQVSLALDVTLVGLIVAAGWGIYTITIFVVSTFSNAHNPKIWYLLAAFFSVTIVTSIGILIDPIFIILAYLVFSIPEASRMAPRMRIIGEATQHARLGKDSVLPSVGFALGNFLSQFLGGQFVDLVGFRPLFIIQGILLLIEAMIFTIFIRGYHIRTPKAS